jgi:hypothetical protein
LAQSISIYDIVSTKSGKFTGEVDRVEIEGQIRRPRSAEIRVGPTQRVDTNNQDSRIGLFGKLKGTFSVAKTLH